MTVSVANLSQTHAVTSALPLVRLVDCGLSLDGSPLLQGIHLEIRSGEVWQIHGAPGSGKSSLLELILGRHRPTEGRRSYPAFAATFPDAAIGIAPRFALQLVSYGEQCRIAEAQASFYQARWHNQWTQPLTVAEFLKPSRVLGVREYEILEDLPVRRDFDVERERGLIELGLSEQRTQPIGQLSNGELKKLLLLAAHLACPAVLLLDDPLGGLDPRARKVVSDVILRWASSGETLVYSTPHEAELEAAATHHFHLDGPRTPARSVPVATLPPHHRLKADEPSRIPREAAGAIRVQPGTESVIRRRDVPVEQTTECVIRCRNIRVTAGQTPILDGIDWDVHRGEQWMCTGPNGSGKSTLLALLMGDHPQAYSNEIEVFGKRLGVTTTLWERRESIGYVAPELGWHYPKGWSVEEVVLSGLYHSIGAFRTPAPDEQAISRAWLRRFRLLHLAQTPLAAISESERRLVLLARAMVHRPPLLLLDEPTQGLSEADRRTFFAQLDEQASSARVTMVLVTHHAHERPQSINRHLELSAGRIAAR